MTPLRHSPLTPSAITVQVQMRRVLLALTPGIVLHSALFGWGIFIQLFIASVAALGFEALMLRLRSRPIGPALGDYSALVTAWLLAICLPPMIPWWMMILGVGFAIVIAKHLYGGLGGNPFNPAMIAYAVLLISFPLEMTRWLAPADLPSSQTLPGFSDTLALIFGGSTPVSLDSISGATPLDHFKHSQEMLPGLLEEKRPVVLRGVGVFEEGHPASSVDDPIGGQLGADGLRQRGQHVHSRCERVAGLV